MLNGNEDYDAGNEVEWMDGWKVKRRKRARSEGKPTDHQHRLDPLLNTSLPLPLHPSGPSKSSEKPMLQRGVC